MKASNLELRFSLLWRLLNGPTLVPEHRFHPTRKWRFDFAHEPSRVAIEIEGGAWSGGRHTRGSGFIKDAEKYLEATLLGWTVVRLVGPQINQENLSRILQLIDRKNQ